MPSLDRLLHEHWDHFSTLTRYEGAVVLKGRFLRLADVIGTAR